MVKTTINLEDEVYRKLLKESIEKYGKTRNLSRLINEKLKMVGMEIPKETKKEIDLVERAFGSWKIKETGSEYVRKIRKESEKRFKRLGI